MDDKKITSDMLLSDYLASSDPDCYRYVGTIWGNAYGAVMPAEAWSRFIIETGFNGRIIDHPATTNSRDDGYYLQGWGDIHYVSCWLSDECVLQRI